MQSKYTTRYLSTLWGKPIRTILRWAAREGWAGKKRTGRGGGMEWFTHSMPEKRCMALAIAEAGKHPTLLVNAKPVPCNSLNGIPEHGRKKAEAKAHILGAVQRARADTPGTAPSVVMEDFVVLYRKRQAGMPEWVYEACPHLSRPTLLNWSKQLEQDGVRGLAKQHEPRPPRNIIDNTPKLHDFARAMLHDYPHTSAAEIQRGMIARFGPFGTAHDPSIKLPCLRSVQLWRKGFVRDNAQLFLAHINPDAARSKHKAAFGERATELAARNHIAHPGFMPGGQPLEVMLNA